MQEKKRKRKRNVFVFVSPKWWKEEAGCTGAKVVLCVPFVALRCRWGDVCGAHCQEARAESLCSATTPPPPFSAAKKWVQMIGEVAFESEPPPPDHDLLRRRGGRLGVIRRARGPPVTHRTWWALHTPQWVAPSFLVLASASDHAQVKQSNKTHIKGFWTSLGGGPTDRLEKGDDWKRGAGCPPPLGWGPGGGVAS